MADEELDPTVVRDDTLDEVAEAARQLTIVEDAYRASVEAVQVTAVALAAARARLEAAVAAAATVPDKV